jgi:hypothetical protein
MTDAQALLYVVHHVFSPPKLPQADDQNSTNDHFLCELTYQSAVAYRVYLPIDQRSQWNSILRMLRNLLHSQKLTVQTVDQSISDMGVGGITVRF